MNFVHWTDVGGLDTGEAFGAVSSLPNSKYHSLKNYYSSTDLKKVYSTSPKKFKWDRDNPVHKDTESKVLGSLVHCFLLTPQDFKDEFWTLPTTINLRTKDGRAERDALEIENAGKQMCDEELIETAERMVDSIKGNVEAMTLLTTAHKEGAYFFTCPLTGLKFKAKIDALGSSLSELKTAKSAHPDEFARQAYNLNYDLSLVHYDFAVKSFHSEWRGDHHFIVVESEAPYICQVFKVGETFLASGHSKWLDAAQKLGRAHFSNDWFGYRPNNEVLTIEAPKWAPLTIEE